MTGQPVAIRARGLVKQFGALTAVNQLDLDVPPGQIYGFLGPNGSGKSTTIRMLCGLLTPTAGVIDVLGLSVPRQAEQLKPDIGYMTQKFSMYGDLSVRQNLEFIADIYSIAKTQRRRRVEHALAQYFLIEQSRQLAATLSGGQRQRLALAAATLHQPRLLLLDEPTSAVDPSSRRDFWERLFELADGGTTILVSTHYMDEAERCHRIAILDRGVKVADGTPKQLGQDIGMQVFEIETDNPNRARRALAGLHDVFSITQLGIRLRVLVPTHVTGAHDTIAAELVNAGLAANVAIVSPSLEDIFVAATGDNAMVKDAA